MIHSLVSRSYLIHFKERKVNKILIMNKMNNIDNHNYDYLNKGIHNNIPVKKSMLISEYRKKNEIELNGYLQETGSKIEVRDFNITNKKHIAFVRNTLITISKLKNQMQHINKILKSNTDISKLEWDEKVSKCETAKAKLVELLKILKNEKFIKGVRKDLQKRASKRTRERLKQAGWKNEKLLRMEQREKLHLLLDDQITSKQVCVVQEKQREMLRKDADVILSDIRSKQSDTRKFLGLLQELRSLRKVKVNIAQARGQYLSLAADNVFCNIIEKLMEQWRNLSHEYSVEEKGLKLMLKTDNERKIEKQEKSIFDEWENILFGKKAWKYLQIHKDVNSFILSRSAWDKFISHDASATPIPIGWVIPEKPSSALWQKCLQTE